jgi:hypothetical protein
MKSNIGRIHDDYLDPDKWLYNNCNDECEGEHVLTASQKRQITRLQNLFTKEESRIFGSVEGRILPTKESLFEYCPDGDFSWGGEPEDVGNAWNCGDSDCESGWHISIQNIEMGREGGKTWFMVTEDSHAGDGDYQPVAGWDERGGDEITHDILSELWWHLEGRIFNHFLGWGRYDLDCAMTGEDPLKNWVSPSRVMTTDGAIKSAQENLKYLVKKNK